MHLARTVREPWRTVPVLSASAGLRMLWSAIRVMSKPLSVSEPWMKTATLSCVPTVPVKVGGLLGQAGMGDGGVPGGAKHTSPISWACV